MSHKVGDVVVVLHFHGNDNLPTAGIVTATHSDGTSDVTVFPAGVASPPAMSIASVPDAGAITGGDPADFLRIDDGSTPAPPAPPADQGSSQGTPVTAPIS